jgi:hypothetical protein
VIVNFHDDGEDEKNGGWCVAGDDVGFDANDDD